MNYILSQEELQTLVVLIGAKSIFGFPSFSASMSREAALATVVKMTEGGILTPEEQGLRLKPEIRSLVEVIAFPERGVLITPAEGTMPQICGYWRQGRLVLVEPIGQQPGRCKVCEKNMDAWIQDLKEDGYLPESPGKDSRVSECPEAVHELLRIPRQSPDYSLPEGVRLTVDLYDADSRNHVARAVVWEQGDCYLMGTARYLENRMERYRPERFSDWLNRQVRGDENDIS